MELLKAADRIIMPVRPVAPSRWTGRWVCLRLREAVAVERRLPRGGNGNGGNGWPAVLHEFTDMVNWTDARQRVWEDWHHAKGAFSFEISRMDEAFGWLPILADHPGERRCLVAYAKCNGSLRRMCKRRGWNRSVFNDRVKTG